MCVLVMFLLVLPPLPVSDARSPLCCGFADNRVSDFVFRLRIFDNVTKKSKSKKLKLAQLDTPSVNVFIEPDALPYLGPDATGLLAAHFRCVLRSLGRIALAPPALSL